MLQTEHAHAPTAQVKTWSKYQEDIFNFVKHESGNAVVEAVAGSGKTTTIVEALKHAKGSTLFLAFNKSIAEELKKRGVNARTFHSLCFSQVLRAREGRTLEVNKIRDVCKKVMNKDENRVYGNFVFKLIGLARQVGIGCLVDDTDDVWMDIIQHHELELDFELGTYKQAIHLARQVLEISNAHLTVDFDDLLYLSVRDKINLPKFDFVFVDEAQDTNSIQRAILRKILRTGARVIAVGDPAQAIYGFRGADSNSLNLIAQEFSCKRLPLTVSYRCATSVVEFSRQWVDHIEAAPNAPIGQVMNLDQDWTLNQFNSGDLVVCRTTRPLIALGYRLLKSQRPFYILGREIGQGLTSLIEKMKASNIRDLVERLGNWKHNELLKAAAQEDEKKQEAINDRFDAIMCLIEGLGDDAQVFTLVNTIESLFAEKKNATVLATIHKAKGLEADHVFWLNASQCPAKWAKQPWQEEQERNLCYVAATRAKTKLTLIEEK